MGEKHFWWYESIAVVLGIISLFGLYRLLASTDVAAKFLSYLSSGPAPDAALRTSLGYMGIVMVAGLTLSAALGTFWLQDLANAEERLTRYAFERAESVARRLVNMVKTRANRLLRKAWKASAHKEQDTESFEELRDYVRADLPEDEDNNLFVDFVTERLHDARTKEQADDYTRWRSDFLGLLARLDTAEPELPRLAEICRDISSAAERYTKQPTGSVALNSIVEQVKNMRSHREAGTRWLKRTLIAFALGSLLCLPAALFDQSPPKQLSWFLVALAFLLVGGACASKLVRICLSSRRTA